MQLTEEFREEENLFRAIKDFPNWWDNETNKPTSAAFKDSNGVSVDRQAARSVEECRDTLLGSFNSLKAIVYISVNDSTSLGAYPYYDPVQDNIYHSILKQADGSIPLTPSIAKKLSRSVKMCYNQE